MNKKTIKGYKGFDKDLKCRGFQYEVGEIYTQEEAPVCCDHGFHFCTNPFDVLKYYDFSDNNRFCEVEALGETDDDTDDTKLATNKIKIGAELGIDGFIKAMVDFTYEHVKKSKTLGTHKRSDNSVATNTGYRSVATNTGDSSVATNTGDRSVATNTGDRSVATNTGDRSVATNTGYRSVATNTGDSSVATNTGDRSVATNTGYRSVATNTGYRSVATNTGYRSVATNTGDRSVATNTGDSSVAINTGQYGIAAALGMYSKAKGGLDTWLVLAEWEEVNYRCQVKEVKTVKVDGKTIKADTLYQLVDGNVVEVKDADL